MRCPVCQKKDCSSLIKKGGWRNAYKCNNCGVEYEKKRTYAKVLTGVCSVVTIVGTVLVGGDPSDAL